MLTKHCNDGNKDGSQTGPLAAVGVSVTPAHWLSLSCALLSTSPTSKSVLRLPRKLGEKEDCPQRLRLFLVVPAHLHGCDHPLWAEKG